MIRKTLVARFALVPCVLGAFQPLAAQDVKWQPSPGHIQIALWPPVSAAGRSGPDSEMVSAANSPVGGRPWHWVGHVSRPTLTVYSPSGTNTGAAVIVFPGGGYEILAIDLEGTEVCDWLTSKGITCVLLKYRVPNAGPSWSRPCGCNLRTQSSMPLEDAQRAIGLVRLHAKEWKIDPHRVGVLGFSAGGHLVAAVSTHFNRRVYRAIDAADRESARPDFAVALYPGHLYDRDRARLFADIHVTHDTPPTMLIQARNDDVDTVANSLVYYAALKHAGVPVELRLYPEGRHAFGLRPTQFPITAWPRLVETWLGALGMIR